MRAGKRQSTPDPGAPDGTIKMLDVESVFAIVCNGDEIRTIPIRQRSWHAMTCTDEACIFEMLRKELS